MRPVPLIALLLLFGLASVPTAQQTTPALAQRIVHTDPARFRPSPAVHGGAGHLDFTALLNANNQDTNFNFLHRGVIAPKSGIGAHFHNECEEMFVILDGEAQFTVDGRTSTLKGPAGAPARMGHSHGLYNATDTPVQWLNINVTAFKGIYDNFDLGDTRVGAPLDPIPTFMTMALDRALLRPSPALYGGTGTAQYRRAFGPTVFATSWSYVDHLFLPAGASTGTHALPDLAEILFVLSGDGTATIDTETAPLRQRRRARPPDGRAPVIVRSRRRRARALDHRRVAQHGHQSRADHDAASRSRTRQLARRLGRCDKKRGRADETHARGRGDGAARVASPGAGRRARHARSVHGHRG